MKKDFLWRQRKLMKRAENFILQVADALMPERFFYDYQKEFAKAIIHAVLTEAGEELTALFARQSGKTETVARVAVALGILLPVFAKDKNLPFQAFRKGLWIGIFAPVKEQAETAFERIIDTLETAITQELLNALNIKICDANKSIRSLSNGSCIRVGTAAPTANIESKTFHLILVEEAQDVNSFKIRKSIEPMLAATSGTLVMIGTANGCRSLFWETIQNNKTRQYKDLSRRFHFEYTWKTVVLNNLRYRAFLNKKVLTRGQAWIASDIFKMAYECIFILERSQFLSIERLQELEALGAEIPRGPYHEQGHCLLNVPMVAGLDWGKSGDSTVVTVIAKYSEYCCIVDWLELLGDDYDTQFELIVTFLKQFPTLELILSETNGVGDPMTDRLKKAASLGSLRASVNGFVATEAHNSDGYKNLLIDFINANRLLIPADQASKNTSEYKKFVAQLTHASKEWRGSHLKVSVPSHNLESTDTLTKHDDYVSSLMIAYWAASRSTTTHIFHKFFQAPS